MEKAEVKIELDLRLYLGEIIHKLCECSVCRVYVIS